METSVSLKVILKSFLVIPFSYINCWFYYIIHDAESGTQVSEKSLFKLTPDFKKIADVDADNSDDILFKFGSIKSDWEKDALRQAW